MPSALRIMNIKIKGFRGINERISLDFDGISALIFGDNGVGKTSLLQAIEWCIFGKLPYEMTEEFKREDAIVNAFTPEKKAYVEFTLKDEAGKLITVTRTRKMAISTTKGKTPVTVTINKEKYTKGAAEEKLAKIIGVTPDEYYGVAHLHQEAIRDLVAGEVVDRSRIVDRMLGLYHLRQFIESLSTRAIETEVNMIKREMEEGRKEKSRYEGLISKSRIDLGELEKGLLSKGVALDTINVQRLSKTFEMVYESLTETARNLGVETKPISPPGGLGDLKERIGQVHRALNEIENKRLVIFGKLKDEHSKLEHLQVDFEKLLSERDKLKIENLQKLAEEKESIATSISNFKKRTTGITEAISKLRIEQSIVTKLLEKEKELQAKLSEFQKQYTDETSINEGIKKITSQIEDAKQMMERQGVLSKLLDLSIQHLEATKSNQCPVCETPKNYEKLLTALKERASKFKEAKLIQKLKSDIDNLHQSKERLQGVLEEFRKVSAEIASTKLNIEKSKGNIQSLGYTPKEPLLDFIQEQIDILLAEDGKIKEEVDKLQMQKHEIELTEQKITTCSRLEKEIQEILHTVSKGHGLSDQLKNKLGEIDLDIKKVTAMDQDFASIRENIALLREGVDYAERKAEITEVETTLLPDIESQLQKLATELSKLQDLGVAIYDIREAAIATQKDLLKSTIASLQNDVNLYYSKLLGHPYYVSLQLEPEEEKGRYVYRIGAYDKEHTQSTFVQTRFSNAQMNIAAISLFLAMASKAPLGFIVFDDPSQSLDSEHKKALSLIMKELSTRMQVFIATQDKELQDYLQEYLPKDSAKVHVFGKWTPRSVSLIS